MGTAQSAFAHPTQLRNQSRVSLVSGDSRRRAKRRGDFPASAGLSGWRAPHWRAGSSPARGLPGDRPREVIALGVTDLGRGLQIGQFLEAFQAFGDHGHAERFAQGLDRPQDALAARTLMDVGDEGAVNLDLVGGDVGQRGKRRIADAEIVDRDLDAELAEDRQDSSWKCDLVTKASSVTSIMKRVGNPVASSALANGPMNSGLPACLAATFMLIVVLGPKVSLIRSIDLTISASTRWVSSSIRPSSVARLMKVLGPG